MSEIQLGNFGKKDSVDIDKLKGGIKQSDINNKRLQQIFTKIDANNNGIIETDEMALFTKNIQDEAKDSGLDNSEAASLMKKMGIERPNVQDLYQFLRITEEQSQNIRSSKTIHSGGQIVGINIEYQPDSEGNIFSSLYNADTGVKISDTIQDKNYAKATTYYQADGETPAYYTLSQGTQTDYIDTMNRVFRREIQKAEGVIDITQYEYEENSTEPYKATTIHADGTITVEENGVKRVVNPDGTEVPVNDAPSDENPQTLVPDTENTELAENTRKLDNGRLLTIKETDDGKVKVTLQENENSEPVELHYDDDGNIISHPKEGETFAQTAKRLGIEKGTPEYEKFKELNEKKKKKGWFLVGAEVKIPAGMEEKVNLEGLTVDNKAEIEKYVDRINGRTPTPTTTPVPTSSPTPTEAPAPTSVPASTSAPAPTEAPVKSTGQPSVAESDTADTQTHTAEPEASAPVAPELTPPPGKPRPAKDIAQSLKDDIYAKTILGLPTTGEDFEKHLAEITPDNVEEVMAVYKKINGDGENLMEAILKERGLSTEDRTAYLMHVKNALITAVKQKGIYVDDISKDFDKEISYQMEKFGLARANIINSFFVKLNDRIENKDDSKITKPNGKIDGTFSQGNTGDCWLLSSIQALSQTPKGLEILNDSVSVDEEGNVTVTLKGAGKSYLITPEELAGNYQFSSGDADVRAIEIAMDRYFIEERGINNWVLFNPATKYDLNSNTASLAFEILTGQGGRNFLTNCIYAKIPDMWFTDSQSDNFNKENHIAVVGAYFKDDRTFSSPDGNGDVTLHTDHAYAVKGSDEKNVYLINPWDTSKIITVPRETFKEFFNSIDEFDL